MSATPSRTPRASDLSEQAARLEAAIDRIIETSDGLACTGCVDLWCTEVAALNQQIRTATALAQRVWEACQRRGSSPRALRGIRATLSAMAESHAFDLLYPEDRAQFHSDYLAALPGRSAFDAAGQERFAQELWSLAGAAAELMQQVRAECARLAAMGKPTSGRSALSAPRLAGMLDASADAIARA